jgi:hypothetical protein
LTSFVEAQGIAVQIKVKQMRNTELSAIRGVINTVQGSNGTATVVFANGPEGTKSLECKFGSPQDPRSILYSGDFFSDQLFDVTINLTVESVN